MSLKGCIKCVVTMNRSESLPRTETLDYLECRTMPKDEDIKIVKNIYLKNLRDKCIILII